MGEVPDRAQAEIEFEARSLTIRTIARVPERKRPAWAESGVTDFRLVQYAVPVLFLSLLLMLI